MIAIVKTEMKTEMKMVMVTTEIVKLTPVTANIPSTMDPPGSDCSKLLMTLQACETGTILSPSFYRGGN